MDDELMRAIALFEEISPEIWHISQEQYAAKVTMSRMWILIFAISILILAIAALRLFTKADVIAVTRTAVDRRAIRRIGGWSCVGAIALLVINLIVRGVVLHSLLLSPDYHTLKIALRLFS